MLDLKSGWYNGSQCRPFEQAFDEHSRQTIGRSRMVLCVYVMTGGVSRRNSQRPASKHYFFKSMLGQCWTSVVDTDPALRQHWFSVFFLAWSAATTGRNHLYPKAKLN